MRPAPGCGPGNGSPTVGSWGCSEQRTRSAPGTVYDDIAGRGCIPVSQCHCKLHGHQYAPGQQVTNNCEQWWVLGPGLGVPVGWDWRVSLTRAPAARQCLQRWPLGVPGPAVPWGLCPGGRLPHHHLRWEEVHVPRGLLLRADQGRQAPRPCAAPRPSCRHGRNALCLPQGTHNDSYAILGELTPCGSTDKQTCLKTVVLLADNKKNVSALSPALPAPCPTALLSPRVPSALPAGGALQVGRQRPAERAAGQPAPRDR